VSLRRRAAAEALGTALLVTVVVGSGISAERLSADPGVQLLINALATVGGLAVAILVVGPVSGAHLNPVISAVDWWLGRRDGTGLGPRALVTYGAAQLVGGLLGTAFAQIMYAEPVVEWSTQQRSGLRLSFAEAVATAGLVLVVVTLARDGSVARTAWAVAAYIGAAYFFTASTSFANPAVTVARMATDTFSGIAPRSAPAFVAAQALGGLVGLAGAVALHPDARAAARDVVVPTGPDGEGGRR
jgi:arsenate reductase